MKAKISPDSVIRYFSGECTKAEEKAVEEWLYANPENARKAQEWLDNIGPSNMSVVNEVQLSRNDVWDELSHTVNTASDTTGWRIRPVKINVTALAAACFGLIVVVFAYWYTPSSTKSEEIVFRTNFGQTSKILLPDSSVVFLNGNSQIRYSAAWIGRERELWLEGEAFFDVQHLRNHSRFLVHLSNQKTIEVLGTEFNVSDRSAGSYIVLKSGSIKLDLPGARPALHLKPGDLIEIQQSEGKIAGIQTKTVDAEAYSMWKEGKWQLESTSLGEMIIKLNETYGLHIRTTRPELLKKQVSGSIPLPRNNREVIVLVEDIASLFQLKFYKKEGIIYLEEQE